MVSSRMRFLAPLSIGLVAGLAPVTGPGPGALQAQTPSTDIFLADLRSENGLSVTGAVNVTMRPGYDNQPSFTPDGRAILYTVIDAGGQADTWRFDLDARRAARVTETTESEYSATVVPAGNAFSAVRVEMDSTQRLWRFDLDGSNPVVVLPDVKPVGYHAWADDTTLALFVLGNPATLQIASTRTGRARAVASDIGRSLHRIPARYAVSFVQRSAGGEAWITELDLGTGATRPLVRAMPGNEFHAWTPDGVLLSGEGSKLYAWRRGEGNWREIADLGDQGVSGISRLAVSPDGRRIAIVASER